MSCCQEPERSPPTATEAEEPASPDSEGESLLLTREPEVGKVQRFLKYQGILISFCCDLPVHIMNSITIVITLAGESC